MRLLFIFPSICCLLSSPQSEQATHPTDCRVPHSMPCPEASSEFLRCSHKCSSGSGHCKTAHNPTHDLSQHPLHITLCSHQEWIGVIPWSTQGTCTLLPSHMYIWSKEKLYTCNHQCMLGRCSTQATVISCPSHYVLY